MMTKHRKVYTEFWKNPMVMEKMTPEDKYFYLYLLTNSNVTQIEIYGISKKQIAFELGYPIDLVQVLMVRFIQYFKLIRYNPETRELAIKNWGKGSPDLYGKLVAESIVSELKEVKDHSLIQYVADSIRKQEIRSSD